MYTNSSSLHRIRGTLLLLLVTGSVLFTILLATKPDRIGPIGVTLLFGLVYIVFSASLQLIILLLRKILARPSSLLQNWQPLYSFVLGFLPTVMLALQSLDQLVARDVFVFGSLVALSLFYASKRTSKNNP